MKILARKNEQKQLEEIFKSKSSEFLAVYGRRRVGKTYLITNYFKDKGIFFHITGIPLETAKQQLVNFNYVYNDIFNKGDVSAVPSSWQKAFHLLREAIAKEQSKEKIILFFDELPWLANKKAGFVEALSYLWNRYLTSDPRIILVVCGSAASWMINNIIDSRGGLYNRITRKMKLQPFNLKKTELYLKGKNVNLSRKQIVEVYMALGGVAAYLDLVKSGKSSSQIITDILFDPQSPLHGEFERLFKSLFTNSELHIKVIRTLFKKNSGMDRTELFSKAGINSGSVQNRIKRELIESGFISEVTFFGNRKKNSKLRLTDEFSTFYLKWSKEIQNSRHQLNPNFWMMMQRSPSWKTWAGYAFETVCQNHICQIANALGISGMIYSYASWSYKAETKADKGVQVDLIIDRSDNCINLCEIKFHESKFTITKKTAEELIYKREKFIEVTQTRKTVFITLLTSFGVKENELYHEVVDNQLSMDDLFAKIDRD